MKGRRREARHGKTYESEGRRVSRGHHQAMPPPDLHVCVRHGVLCVLRARLGLLLLLLGLLHLLLELPHAPLGLPQVALKLRDAALRLRGRRKGHKLLSRGHGKKGATGTRQGTGRFWGFGEGSRTRIDNQGRARVQGVGGGGGGVARSGRKAPLWSCARRPLHAPRPPCRCPGRGEASRSAAPRPGSPWSGAPARMRGRAEQWQENISDLRRRQGEGITDVTGLRQ